MPLEEYPQIVMRVMVDGQLELWVRYLVRVNGVPWAFARPEDAALDPLVAKALLLDPTLLEEQTDSVTGELSYLYRAVYHVHR